MQTYQIATRRGGVVAHVLAPEKFNGEYERRSALYVGAVWAISIVAMLTNTAQALYRKSTRLRGGGPWPDSLAVGPRP